MADDDDAPPPPPTMESMFVAFAQFGASSDHDGSTILLSQCDMWMKQSKLFNKKFTMTDTGMAFSVYKQRSITYEMFYEFLEKLCNDKDMNIKDVEEKMISCGSPGSQKLVGLILVKVIFSFYWLVDSRFWDRRIRKFGNMN